MARRVGSAPVAERYPLAMSVEIDFEQEVEEPLASLPRELGDVISNVAIIVDEAPPPG